MFANQLIGKVNYIIEEDGQTFIKDVKTDMKEALFLAYYLIRISKEDKALPIIGLLAETAVNLSCSLFDSAMWLWVVGEYTNATKDNKLLERYKDNIKDCIIHLSESWDTPQNNWLNLMGKDVFTSNIAAVFGAIQSINNVVSNTDAQKMQKRIKEYLYEKLLVDGKVVSGLVNREPMGDIGIIAVPFGLMTAGNQILVESMQYVEDELIGKCVRFSKRDVYYGGCERADVACLLSWYYSERGDIARAKLLLSKIDEIWQADEKLFEVDADTAVEKVFSKQDINVGEVKESALSYVLYAIAAQNIADKETTKDTDSAIDIIHKPGGTGNRYMVETMQRIPIYPTQNENVFVRMVTHPLNMVKEAYITYTIDGKKQQDIKMQLETSSEGEKYWEANIGSFDYSRSIDYKFIVTTKDGLQVVSPRHTFTVRNWVPIGSMVCAEIEKDSVELSFPPLSKGGKMPCLKISESSKQDLNLLFVMKDGLTDCAMSEELHERINHGNSKLAIDFFEGHLSIGWNDNRSYANSGKSFAELLTDGSGVVYKMRYNIEMASDEKFFGMGERYSNIEYRGLDIDNYVYNQYTNQKLRTYIPIPFAISSKGYGVFADTTMYSIFRFGTRVNDLLEIEVDIDKNDQTLCTYIFNGSPKENIQSFSSITGKPALPPKWAFGPWMSSNNWDTQEITLKQVELTNKYEIPATVLVLEQWSDEATFYIFNDAIYEKKNGEESFKYSDFTFPEWGRWPDPRGMVEELHRYGLKVLLWQVAAQAHLDGIGHLQKDEDDRVMVKEGYCVKLQNGEPYRIPAYEWFKRSLIPDFSNPEAKKWWLGKREYLLKEVKIDGFKTDGAECVYNEDLLFFDGRTGSQMRNQYPNDYIASYHEFAKQHCDGDAVTFSRAGYTGAQAMPLHWAGDESSTFEAFRSSVNAGLSCGMSGIPFWGWDIAGFHGEIPTAELFIRSTQFAAFCPVMQYHAETKGEFNRDRTPWNIAERTQEPQALSLYKKYADLRMNILPYIYEQAKFSSKTGIPMMRAMFVEYPEDPRSVEMTEQYMFGERLLVAPVFKESSSVKEVYLPEGNWVEFFDGEEYKGKQLITVKSSLDKIPVFIKENSVVALNLADDLKLCSYVGNGTDGYRNLCLMMYVTSQISYYFSDEMGNSLDIHASKTQDSLNISFEGDLCIPLTLIIKDPNAEYECIEMNGKELLSSKKVPINTGTYLVRDREILITVQSGAKIICKSH